MKSYNVIFCGTVRNVEPYIQSVIDHIDRCGKKFNQYSVVIYENDSTDNTRDILNANRKANYHYIFEDDIKEPRRTVRLANGRNRILDEIAKLNRTGVYDYIIMLDMDDVNAKGSFVDSIESCFDYDPDTWDVLAGNQHGIYYDIYALRQDGYIDYDFWKERERPGITEEEKKHVNDILHGTHYDEQDSLIEVESAFGAIAIYKASAIGDARYIGNFPDESETCEHVAFHKHIKDNGGKIFINTSFFTD